MKIIHSKIILILLPLFCIIFLGLISPSERIQAANSLDLVINEIAWMGTQTAFQDEWIELYNNTDSEINLDGWLLQSQDGTLEINLTGIIQAHSFYLLERTDDTTLPDIAADQIYTGALGNDGEYLKLFDAQSNLVDEANCNDGWFGGDNSTKQTMERKIPALSGAVFESWQTSQNPGGTPKSQNSAGQPSEPACEPTTEICDSMDNDCNGQIDENDVCKTPEPPPEPNPQPTETPIVYPVDIFINEFLPSPEGSDAEEEFIEFFNSNPNLVDIFGWKVEDTQGATKVYTFSQGTTISAYGFFVLKRPDSQIVLNNEGEGLVLKNPLGNIIHSASFPEEAFQGQSFAKKDDGIFSWTLRLTPGAKNIFEILQETQSESQPIPQVKYPSEESFKEKTKSQTSQENENQEEKEPSSYPLGILLNEILPSPGGPDEDEEWIEIFNQNNFMVDLSGWQIQDTKGKIKFYTLPQGTQIGSQEFLVLSRLTTKITLNNDDDGLILIQPDNNIADQVSYNKAPTGSSYNRIGSDWAWSDTLTPGSNNVATVQASEEIGEETEGSFIISGKGLAALGKQLQNSSRPLFVLLIALILAIASGIIVLLIKKRIKSS